MKKILYCFTAALIAVSSVTSCNKDKKPQPPAEENLKIKITALDWENTNVEFEDGETIGVYAANGESLASERFIDNEIFTKDGEYFLPSRQIPAPEQQSKFAVCKPAITAAAGSEIADVSVSADQSSLENFVNSDLAAGVTVYAPAEEAAPVDVELKRMFAKINISATVPEGADIDLASAKFTFKLNTAAQLNLDQASVSSPSEPKDMTPKGKMEFNDGKFSGISLITVPQTVTAADEVIIIKLGAEESFLSFGREIEFKSGMQYNIDLKIDNVGINYNVEFTIEEEPWAFGDDIDETIDIESDDITSVVDIDGNEYPVVRIGKYLWMASNLITTKYNDGTPITLIPGNESWQNTTYTKEGAYVYYQMNEVNIPKYGMYYNWYAVNTGKLCPKGWRMPSQEDYLELVDVLGGPAAAHLAMKSTSGWKDWDMQELPKYQGTNTSGFNGVPAGYRLDGGEFKNQQEFAYFWTSTSTEYRAYSIVLAAMNEEIITDNDVHRAIGMAVRCVKY